MIKQWYDNKMIGPNHSGHYWFTYESFLCNEDTLAFMAENGWEVVLHCVPDGFCTSYKDAGGQTQTHNPVSDLETYYLNSPEWVAIQDYGGIPLWCDIQFVASSDIVTSYFHDPIPYNWVVAHPRTNAPQSLWESEIGDALDRMEEEGSYFKGYQFEGGAHQFYDTIRAHSNREICQWLWPGDWGSIHPENGGTWDSAAYTRQPFTQLDGNCTQYAWEIFNQANIFYGVIDQAIYVNEHSTHPNMIQSWIGGDNRWGNNAVWDEVGDCVGVGCNGPASQMQRMLKCMYWLTLQVGQLFAGFNMQQSSDVLHTYPTTDPAAGSPSVQVLDELLETINSFLNSSQVELTNMAYLT